MKKHSGRKNRIILCCMAILCVLLAAGMILGFAHVKNGNKQRQSVQITGEQTLMAIEASEHETETDAETGAEPESETGWELEFETGWALESEEDEDAHIYVSEEQVEQFFEEEIPTEDEEAWELPQRTLTNECIPYDGVWREISCWGDSMTVGVGSGKAVITVNGVKKDISYCSYPSVLQELTGITTHNLGYPGDTSWQIAVRQGGIAMVTDREITITPNGTSVCRLYTEDGSIGISLSDYSGYGWEDAGYENVCYIAGIPCVITEKGADRLVSRYYGMSLARAVRQIYYSGKRFSVNADGARTADTTTEEMTTQSKTETQTETQPQEPTQEPSVEQVIVPAGTVVYPKAAIDRRNDILILEIGSNGGWESDYQTLIQQYDAMIESAGCPYYIVIGDTDDPGTSVGDTNQGERNEDGSRIGIGDTAWEAALREAYGDHFLNMRTYLIENGLTDNGLEASKRDLYNYAKGNISRQLRSDWTHLNAYGYYSKGIGVYKKGVELGYWK